MAEIINLNTVDGQKYLQDVSRAGTFYQPNLLTIFEKQKQQYNCGIVSCCLLMNAAYVGGHGHNMDAQHLNLPFKEETMFDFPETLRIKTQQDVTKDGGLTLEELGNLVKSHGHEAEIYYSSSSSAEQFEQYVKQVLCSSNSESGVIVNYHMGTLGQGLDAGHHSPLAAYHENVNRVLLMDTGKPREICWVKLDALFHAMKNVYSASGKTRGYCIFKHKTKSGK